MRHHRKIAVLALAAFAGLAACGSDDESADPTAAPVVATAPATTHSGTHPDTAPHGEPPTSPTAAPTSEPTSKPASEPTTAADDANVLTIELSDYTFGELPESVPAGTKLAVKNIAEGELHEVVAFKIHDGEDRSAEELLALPEEELLAVVGPMPATVLLATPGESQIEALGDGTLSEPGRYLLLCAIPTGIDPAVYLAAAAEAAGGPPNVAGGPPHFMNGMFAELVVE